MNPKYKERVKVELDHMLDTGIIEPVEESELISPIVIQDKKTTDEVRICVDLRKLNDTCLHDPFPTPFTDEVLESALRKNKKEYDYFLYYLERIIFQQIN